MKEQESKRETKMCCDLPVSFAFGFIFASVLDAFHLIHHCLNDHLVSLMDGSNWYVTNRTKLTWYRRIIQTNNILPYQHYKQWISMIFPIPANFSPQLLRCSFSSRKKFHTNLRKISSKARTETTMSLSTWKEAFISFTFRNGVKLLTADREW